MDLDHVRVCPVCETENPPEYARCRCGASLSAVDFSLKRAPADGVVAASPAATAVPEASIPSSTSPNSVLPESVATAGLTAHAAPLSAGEERTVCPHADCAQLNPLGRERCIYCNRPLAAPASKAAGLDARPLPAALLKEYRAVEAMAAAGAEADLLIVRNLSSGELSIAKLYRRGLEPDQRLLALLSQVKGNHIARVLTYGVSDGTAYEVEEYIAHGTLRDWMRERPLSRDDVRSIVRELAAALNSIHALRILHRDLKPENVLVRSANPLELALTDFGIASLREATQHFTGGARTAKYAAPEALTGVIDEKADWWACGMIALEAAVGRHPFDGLNEQVINHRLATRPIDVRGVYDDALRTLCRGLLLRDPKLRWGGAEVTRWLADDPTLTASDDADGPASAVRPYRIGKVECTTATELGAALARHWDAAAKDLARGQLARWVEHELHDYNLVRKLRDLEDERGLSADMRLLRFLLLSAPDMPAVWRGAAVSAEALLDAARKAAGGDEASEAWLDSIAHEGVLGVLGDAGNVELAAFDRSWRNGWARFVEIWRRAETGEETWRKQPRAVAGVESARVVSFDDLLFGASGRLALPAQEKVNASLLLALHDERYAAALRGEVATGQTGVAGFCSWYDELWNGAENDSVGVIVAQRMLPHARDDASMESRRHAATENVRATIVEEAREEVRSSLANILRFAELAHDLDARTSARMLNALEPFQRACHRALGLGFADGEYLNFCHDIEKIFRHGLAVQDALVRCEAVHATNSIFMHPARVLIATIVVGGVFLLWSPWSALAMVALAAAALGYRWYLGHEATERALSALRRLRVYAKGLVAGGVAPPPRDDAPRAHGPMA